MKKQRKNYRLCSLLFLVFYSKCQRLSAIEIPQSFISIRGGSYIEPNPNYAKTINPSQFMPPTLGDVENNQILQPSTDSFSQQYVMNSNSKIPKPIVQVIQEFFVKLHQSSPTIFYGTVFSLVVFIAWQIPTFSAILRRNFICSRYNLSKRRYHTLFTSSISHTTLSHFFINLYGFIMFGKSVEPILKMNSMSLSLFCVLSAFFSNALFLLLCINGSCIGLSGVVLSLFAFDAKMNPGREIGFFIRFIPIRLPAHYALIGLLVWSIFGTLALNQGRGDGVAHASHLGGIIFGAIMYEMLNRGVWKEGRRRLWMRFNSKKRRI